MAYYLPALPWILWMSSIIGWLILIVETLFAAPLWAVAHMIPSEGDGMAGQHGKQGYMLLFGILARPPLMVAGLFAAMIIMMGIGKFVGFAFLVYYSSVSAGHVGIVSWIVHSIMLCAAMVIFSHKIFGLITHLPDKVIRWIGQMHDDLGTGESENRFRGIAAAGAAHISSGAATAAKTLAGPKSPGGAPGEPKADTPGESPGAKKETAALSTGMQQDSRKEDDKGGM
jgi:hypothetical protein